MQGSINERIRKKLRDANGKIGSATLSWTEKIRACKINISS